MFKTPSPARQFELFCEPCDVPICVNCAASDEHKQHEFIDILTKIENKKEKIKLDLQELERSIYSKYQEAALKIQLMKNEVKENTRKLSIALRRQGKIWHRKITSVIWNLQSIINESQSALLDSLLKEENKLSHRITEIAERILELMKIQESNDACLISKYKNISQGLMSSKNGLPVFLLPFRTFAPRKSTENYRVKLSDVCCPNFS